MADYDAIRRTIDANIYANGEQKITGEILNDVLNEMVDVQEEFNGEIDNLVENYPNITINGDVTNAPDEEDITSDANNRLKFANRPNLNGMGYVILRKNKSFAEQVTLANTIYEIRYEFDLGGEEVTIPENSVLKFEGGQLNNGTVNLSENTTIKDGVCNDVQFLVSAPNITILDTTIHNVNIGAPIVTWHPKSNLTIKGCDLRNESPRVAGESVSGHCDCIFLTLKEDIENVVIENCTIAARVMCIEIYTFNQETLAVARKVAVRNNRLTQLEIDDPSVQSNACWPLSFSGNPQESIIEGNIINGGYYGIEVVSCTGVDIVNNDISNTIHGGVFVTGTANKCRVLNNRIKNCNYPLIVLANTTNIDIVGNIIDGEIFDSSVANYNTLDVRGTHINFSGNVVYNSGVLSQGSDIIISKNIFRNLLSTYPDVYLIGGDGIVVEDNQFDNDGGATYVCFRVGSVTNYKVNRNVFDNGNAGATTIPSIYAISSDDYNITNGLLQRQNYSTDLVAPSGENGKIVVDTTARLLITAFNGRFFKPDGSVAGTKTYGSATTDRPNATEIATLYGFRFFDRTLNKPLFAKNIYTSSGRVDWIEGDGEVAGIRRSGTTAQRPTPTNIGFTYLDTTLGKLIVWDGTSWVNIDGTPLLSTSGTTANRPSASDAGAGFTYFDTNLGKMIVSNGTTWVNMDGTALA